MTTYTVHYPTGDTFDTADAQMAEEWSRAGCTVTAVTQA